IIKPNFFSLNNSIVRCVLSVFLNRMKYNIISWKMVIASFITVGIIFASELNYVSDKFKTYSKDASEIARNITDNYSVCNDEITNVLSGSLNIRAGLVIPHNGDKCLIKPDRARFISDEESEAILSRVGEKYVTSTYSNGVNQFIGFISKKGLVERYRTPNLVDSLSYRQMIFLNSIYINDVIVFKNNAFEESNSASYKFYIDGDLSSVAEFKIDFTNVFYNSIVLYSIFLLFFIFLYLIKLLFLAYFIRGYSLKLEPIIDVKESKVIYYEVLSRFFDVVNVNKFICFLRRLDLLEELTLLQVCLISSNYKNDAMIGFNICPAMLKKNNSLVVKSLIDISSRVNIVVELTEDEGVTLNKTVYDNLKLLKFYGIKISLDDFGVGINNLDKINIIEPDFVKVDKIFIHDDMLFQGVVKSLSSYGNMFDIICEGVETIEMQSRALKLDVYFHQGFFYQ
ncbi:EAL domain-containing protein, partial [Vibrio fluvialis]|nr:EAL domain-containing protein [Vibrio fluvialis]